MDKKKQYAIIGVLAGLILTAVIVLAVMNSGGSSDSADTTPPTSGGGPSAGRKPPTADAPTQAQRGVMQPPASSAGRDPFAAGGKKPQVAALPGHKQDPFYYKPNDKSLPPPPNIFDTGVEPIRVASANQEKTPVHNPPPVRVVPNRRVSGIMSGDGVYAIIENTDGSVEIVKPGSKTKDGYTVVSITDTSVLLRQEDPAYPYHLYADGHVYRCAGQQYTGRRQWWKRRRGQRRQWKWQWRKRW